MDLGTFLGDVVYAISIAAWIAFLAPPAIWVIRHRHNMPWERIRSPIQNTLTDVGLGIVCLIGLGLLNGTGAI